jgi:hypothetical protein
MRRSFVCLAVVAACILACGASWAEEEKATKDKSALWEFGGGVKLAGVYRDTGFDHMFPRSGSSTGMSEFFIDALITLSLNIRISNTANLFVQLETQDDAFAGESHRVGDNNQIVNFEQGWLKVEEIFGQDVDISLKIGLMEVRFDTRNLGRDAFLLDVTGSENPFTGLPNLSARANGVSQFTTHPVQSVVDSYGFTRNKSFGGNAWIHNYVGQSKNSEAGGAILTWAIGDDVLLDLGALTVMEGGLTVKDTNIFFLNFDFEFDLGGAEKAIRVADSFEDRSLVNIVAVAFLSEHSMVANVGLGFDLIFDVGRTLEFEIYGEAHYQYGGKYYTETDTSVVPADRVLIRHDAHAAYAGMRVKIMDEGRIRPYLDISYWRISGDTGDVNEENGDFMSMENVDTLLILEGDELGFDIDCNYWAIKAEIGFRLPSALNAISIRITGGFFSLLNTPKDITYMNDPAALYPSYAQEFDPDTRKDLGIEVDLRIAWEVSEEAKIFLAGGMLFNSTVLENLSTMHNATDASDSTFCALAGIELKF